MNEREILDKINEMIESSHDFAEHMGALKDAKSFAYAFHVGETTALDELKKFILGIE